MLDKIELLPEHIIDQIKAGEVIERPSTLIKELLENSIDAKSSKIKIHIINSGLDLISVEDNGVGITHDDLPLAFSRHATSKIENFEDIYKLITYGFRGEALASIASVSKVTCQTNKVNCCPSTIKFEGPKEVLYAKDEKTKCSSGTSIFIKDLFFNTPVRMKFIQSKQSEKNQLRRIINAFILTHPEVEFDVTWDEDSKVRYHSVDEDLITKRVKDLFEKRASPLELISTTSAYDGFRVKVILSKNSQKGNSGKFHYLFINDRLVHDIQIHKIILNSASNLWPSNESGNYCAFIDAPADQIDVNVHPNKTIVKIFQAPKLYSLISSSIKDLSYKERNDKSGPTQAQSNFTFNDTQKESNIHYKEQKFDQDFDIQTYFDVLDNKENLSIKKSASFQTKSFTLFNFKDQILLIDNKNFLFHLMSKMLMGQEVSSTPLLVSEPFQIKDSNKDEEIFKLIDIGFELDRLDDETIVLRSFPEVLNDFPYIEFLKHKLLKITNTPIQSEVKLKEFQIIKGIELLGVSSLLKEGLIKILNDKNLAELMK